MSYNRNILYIRWGKVLLTIDDSSHPPESQQDKETHPIKGILMEDEHNVQDKGNHHHGSIKHLKLVMKELNAVSVELTNQLHHEEWEKSQAQVVEHLK